MKRNAKSLVILAVVFALILLVYFGVILGKNAASEKKQAEAAIPVGNLVDVVDLTYSTGESSLHFINSDNLWQYADDVDFPLDAYWIRQLNTILVGLTASRQIEISDSLVSYGLETPARTLRAVDSNGNVLFSGGDTNTAMGSANSQLSIKSKAENMVKSEVKDVVLGTEVYDNVEVGLNLNMNFDSEEYMNHHYYVDEGQEQGYLDSESVFESEATGGEAGVPGTTANDDPTYVMPDGETTSSSVSERKSNYLPSEEITKRNSEGSSIDYANSSISVVGISYVVYDEKALKADGTLANMTFDEFVAQNSDRIKTTVDQDFYDAVANATGIPVENISFMAYDVPFFKYASSTGREIADYLQILLAVLIFGLLGFVVFRSTRKPQEEVIEPELSVETLLETTKEATQEGLEDIGYAEKSETRILIERFVEENPEAAATLLRNWLNEEWE